ncbi:hypothetical protein CCR75_002074 [Bremia lactucae]|uniref:Uncharacterized protein n=1 Tax=Bremia lactucae TaxID=4779 RepID=A0A976IJH7_BRELC|nr:hypothetical protein CCR75_002074 [Bremia lactucae]
MLVGSGRSHCAGASSLILLRGASCHCEVENDFSALLNLMYHSNGLLASWSYQQQQANPKM